MGTTRISADDAMQLAADRRARVPMQLGALLRLDPPGAGGPSAREVAATVGRRLAVVAELGRRLERPPWGVGRPCWVEDGRTPPVRVVRLDTSEPAGAPSGARPEGDVLERRLLDHFARLVTTRLPSDRPLWRAEVVADHAGRPVGVVVVAHHVVTDGMGGLALLEVLAEPAGGSEPAAAGALAKGEPRVGGAPSPGEPAAAPRRGQEPGRPGRGARARRLAWAARELGLRRVRLADPCSVLQPTGPHRTVDVVDVELARVVAAARRLDATVNDVVLAAVSGALVRLLGHRHESVRALTVSVPVSARPAGARLGNAVGVLPVRVPATTDAGVRLAAVRAARGRLAHGRRGSSSALLGPVFRLLATLGAVQWLLDHQRLVHAFETNVRGPARHLAVAGVPVRRIVPLAVNAGNTTVSFDVLSTGGRLVVGVVTDPDRVPDRDVLVAAVRSELDGLLREEVLPRGDDAARGAGASATGATARGSGGTG
ncbi:wax ester/triacylglycerol synthase family O-acyltransferase [Phycicoccus ginsengisoli]